MSKDQLMQELRQSIIDKKVAVDLAAGAKNLVMGDGNLNAEIVLIGEAPGKNEDETGLPFVGAAGKFLDEMLVAAELDRKSVYITNIVKYRPPSNRDPLPSEKAEFWPYLMRQLEIINPKAIITLGRHSGANFIPDLHISTDHGKARMVKYHDREWLVIPLYHPAAALYNGGMRQTLIDDFIGAYDLVKNQAKLDS